MVREANKGVRLEWAKEMLKNSEQFDDVIFTDEFIFQVDYHARRAYRRVGEPRVLRPKPKHPAKVHVWGGISKRGATNIVAFQANMTATQYTQILGAAFVPFATSVSPEGHRLYQDNGPKHTSRWARCYF